MGERVRANVENWLLRAPQANPGIIEMFRMRDRQPVPRLTPWAGEFAGKYLISAVQALRMSDEPRLRAQVEALVAQWTESQAEDGYLGPFPKQERLLKHWDLWGHYHAILGLLLWHEYSGDTAALAATRKAADLICRTYLDSGRRVFDAGDHEMNMAILTGILRLYRITGEPRYLRMAREVEKDWERAGDYLRAGLDGQEFFRTPRPRWESLHDLQGLLELWQVTGEPLYREAFEHHWRSIRRWDRRNTGGFSSGEQATGNPYAATAIETCCTVAWMALTVDYLHLTGDPRAADELEVSTLNAGLGAQHPSGSWWTYNTPMDGSREASAHSIVFQARAGTPELNCCSVNGPRVLGMLSDWAVNSISNGIAVNWLGSGFFKGKLASGAPVTITSTGEAWRDGTLELRVSTAAPETFTLFVRIPSWARDVRAQLNGSPVSGADPGTYLKLTKTWSTSDRLTLQWQIPIRTVAGANEVAGKVSVYRGPILLAYDQAQNTFDEDAIPEMDLEHLEKAQVVPLQNSARRDGFTPPPWLTVDVPTVQGGTLRLVDFASAGSAGTRYRSWLPANPSPPPPALTRLPADAGRVPVGPVLFQWRGPGRSKCSYRVEFSTNELFTVGRTWATNTTETRVLIDLRSFPASWDKAGKLWWRVVSSNANGQSLADAPPAWFRMDASAPAQAIPPETRIGPSGELIVHSLRGNAPPEFGEIVPTQVTENAEDGTEVNGRDQKLVYLVPAWPEEDYTVSVRVCIRDLPQKRVGQIFSAWAGNMDDPLRLVVQNDQVFARIEAGGNFTTPGTRIEAGRWYSLTAVKESTTLTLYLDGIAVGSGTVPMYNSTSARDCALGGNPHFAGNEFLAARFADFRLYARALSPTEVRPLTAGIGGP